MTLGPHTIVVLRAGSSASEDEYGNALPGAPVRTPVYGCSVQPGGGSEVEDRREATTTLWTVWAPLCADVQDTDKVEVWGTEYAVDGPIERWEFGTPLDHLVVRLRAVAG